MRNVTPTHTLSVLPFLILNINHLSLSFFTVLLHPSTQLIESSSHLLNDAEHKLGVC